MYLMIFYKTNMAGAIFLANKTILGVIMYYGERKKGCRFIEVVFHGCRSLIIENSAMRMMILLDKGMNIVSYVLKQTDTEFIWTNPMGLSCIEKNRLSKMDKYSESDNYVGGFFEIMPNVGGSCKFESMHFCDNSETAYLPWDYQVVEDTEEKMVFQFCTKLSKYPFYIKKTMTIKDGTPEVEFEESVKNLGSIPLKYQWALHPNIGGTFLSGRCVIETPFSDSMPVPCEGAMKQSLRIYDCAGDGVACVRDTVSKTGFALSWDVSVFSHCGIWINSGYSNGHHRHGGAYVVSVLPINSGCFGIDEAVRSDDCDVLGGGESHSCSYRFSAFRGESPYGA